jgi:hypothetical protein
MSAIVTDKIKKQFLEDMFKDFDSAGVRYYAGIARSEQWDDQDNVATPQPRKRDERDARMNMQSVKNITDRSFVVPRSNWSSGTQYSPYDDNHIGYPLQPYYVMNSNQEIYVCLQQGRDANGTPVNSTTQPTGNTTGVPFTTADGYVWKFLYSIGALLASKFLSSSYIPVQLVDSDEAASVDATAEQVEQRAVQLAATPGEIVGVQVVGGGNNYTGTPTAKIDGDGTGAEVVAIVSGNSVVNLRVKQDSDGNLQGTNPNGWSTGSFRGSGYKRASISFTGGGGTGASGRVILGPENGLGADPRDDLKSGACMFNAKIDGAEGGDFLLGDNTFRQVLLLRNPLVRDSANRSELDFFTDATGSTLDRVILTSINGSFVEDQFITAQNGDTPFSKAYIDTVDSVSVDGSQARLLVHQNEGTGFTPFIGQSVTLDVADGNGTNTGKILQNNYIRGEVDPLSGELLYIDNRAAVDRSSEQTEDLKIVIQL